MTTKPTPAVLSEDLRKLVTDADMQVLENLFVVYRKEVAAIQFITEAFLKEAQTPGMVQALSRAAEYIQHITETLVRKIEVYFKDTYYISFNPFTRTPGAVLENANDILEFILVQIGDVFHHAGGGNLREHLSEVLQDKPIRQLDEILVIGDAVRIQKDNDTTPFRIFSGDNTALLLASYLQFCYEHTTQLSSTQRHIVDGWKLELCKDGVALGIGNVIFQLGTNGIVQIHHPSASDALAFAHLLDVKINKKPL